VLSAGRCISPNRESGAMEADAELKRLFDAVENGVTDLSDLMLKDRIAELKAIRDQARADIERAESAKERLGPTITTQSIDAFARTARKRMRIEGGGYRREYLPRARPARRNRRSRTSHNGVEERTAAHARRRFERKNGGFWCAQFCTEVARPKRFELLAPQIRSLGAEIALRFKHPAMAGRGC
jgi:hypothetical protein